MTEDTTLVELRYELASERLAQIPLEKEVAEPFRPFFAGAAKWLLLLVSEGQFLERLREGKEEKSALAEHNHALYAEILPGSYEHSFANPAFACSALGSEFGPLLCALYYELRGCIPFVYRGETERLLIRMELLLEIYSAFMVSYREEGGVPPYKAVRDIISLYLCDYAQDEEVGRLKGLCDPAALAVREMLREEGIEGIMPLTERTLFVLPGTEGNGVQGKDPNPQFTADHREDLALFLDPLFVNRKLEGIRGAAEEVRELLRECAPVPVEVGAETDGLQGERAALPARAAQAPSMSAKQRRMAAELEEAAGLIWKEFTV